MNNIIATLRTPKGCLGCLGLVLIIVALFVGGLMLGGIANAAYQLPEISLAAEEIPLPFTVPLLGHSVPNTLPTTWLTMFLLIVVSFFATRKMDLVPSGLQNAVEAIVEMFYGFPDHFFFFFGILPIEGVHICIFSFFVNSCFYIEFFE